MRTDDQKSSVSKQVERAANEGMVDVAPPRPHMSAKPKGNLADTKRTARLLLELQLVAQRAYDKALETLEASDDAKTIAVAAERLREDINATRAQLARMHEQDPVEASTGAATIEKVTGIATAMLGEAVSAKGLMVGEKALAKTAETMLDRIDLLPEIEGPLRRATVDAAKDRAATLELLA